MDVDETVEEERHAALSKNSAGRVGRRSRVLMLEADDTLLEVRKVLSEEDALSQKDAPSSSTKKTQQDSQYSHKETKDEPWEEIALARFREFATEQLMEDFKEMSKEVGVSPEEMEAIKSKLNMGKIFKAVERNQEYVDSVFTGYLNEYCIFNEKKLSEDKNSVFVKRALYHSQQEKELAEWDAILEQVESKKKRLEEKLKHLESGAKDQSAGKLSKECEQFMSKKPDYAAITAMCNEVLEEEHGQSQELEALCRNVQHRVQQTKTRLEKIVKDSGSTSAESPLDIIKSLQ